MLNKVLRSVFWSFLLIFAVNINAQTIAYSPDGQTIAVNWVIDFAVSNDLSQFLVYDAKTGKLKSWLNTQETPNNIIFSPDSKSLIMAERLLLEKAGFNAKGDFSILDNPKSTANLLVDRKNQEEINSSLLGVAFSADGSTVYKLYPNFLTAYSFPELNHLPAKSRFIELTDKTKPEYHFVGISKDARFIVESEYIGNKSALVVKEAGKPNVKIDLGEYKDEDAFPNLTASISQNNEILMLRSEYVTDLASQVGFWDLKTKKFIGNLLIPMLDAESKDQTYRIDAVIISPDGKKSAAKFDAVDEKAQEVSMIAIFDIPTKKTSYVIVKKEDDRRFAEAMSFSSDSKNIVTLSSVLSRASFTPVIEIWNTEDGKKLGQLE